eukprot:gene19860-28113_t
MVSIRTPFLALLAAQAAWAAPADPTAALPVPTVVVGQAAGVGRFEIEGSLQAQQQATVAAQTQGRVLALAVKLGDRVKAGQVLARIDNREQQTGVAGSEAATAQAQAALVQAEQQAARTRELRNQGFMSAAALDDALARLKVAQGALQRWIEALRPAFEAPLTRPYRQAGLHDHRFSFLTGYLQLGEQAFEFLRFAILALCP